MTKRLTRRAEADGIKAVWFGNRECFLEGECGYTEAEKLAHYEDLEEQGRLHIVPKPFWDKIMEHLIKMDCPHEHGLKGFDEDDCKVDDGRCRLCWEMALKVGGEK